MRSDEQENPRPATTSPERGEAVSLFAVLPDLLEVVPDRERQLALRSLITPAVTVQDQDLAEAIASTMPGAFDFLIVDGVVLKETSLRNRAALELLGPGDVIAPPLSAAHRLESRAISRYVAHGRVMLAVLGSRFREAARRWPGLSDVLHDRLGRQTHRASMHMAMLHMPRIEDRVMALFADLAERFGHVTAEGVLIELTLTHELIGQLVASRRPTVSLALHELESAGLVTRGESGGWKLAVSAISP